jgi:hypothetical protein
MTTEIRLKERRLAAHQKRRQERTKWRMGRGRGRHGYWWQAGQRLLMATKSEWGPGPWQDEPDRLEWRHASGLPCLIVRNHMGSLCGYVGVPPAHPLYMRHYDRCDVEVHGGLTHSDHCHGGICHKPEPGEETDIWWLGFDCAHWGDLMPSWRRLEGAYARIGWPLETGEYRSIAYVQAEVERLAEQVKEASDG